MWEVVGQERAVAALKGALAGGALAHAYLLAGPPRVGKATLARNLAQALNCDGGDPPCGECRPCRRIAQGLHADVMTVTIEGGDERAHKEIGIDQVREVEHRVSLQPYEGRWRVVIVDPAEAMSAPAQNASLKTLDEPPPNVVFLLITSDEEGLLPTIRSRCQRIEMSCPSLAQVEKALRDRWGAPPEEAQMLARLCQGRLGWAVAALQDGSLLKQRDETLEEVRRLASLDIRERFGYAADLGLLFNRDRPAVNAVLDLWLEWWRDVLLVKAGCADQTVNRHLLAGLRAMAADYDMAAVVQLLTALREAKRNLDDNANPRLALEVLMLELPTANGGGKGEAKGRKTGPAPATYSS